MFPTDIFRSCPQTDFLVMSMSGGADGWRETRMDSTLPTVDANGKESADNDTNRDLAGPPNNVITRSNGNTTSQIPPHPRHVSRSSPTATDNPSGAADSSQQPQGILPWPTGRTNICEIAANSGPPPDRASIDDTPISPTTSREPPVRPTVRLPSQTSAQATATDSSNIDDETAISPTSRAGPQAQAMVPPPLQTGRAVNANDRSDDSVEPESAISPSTRRPDQGFAGTAAPGRDEAARISLMLSSADASSPTLETPMDEQAQAVESRDFAAEIEALDREVSEPPQEPSIAPQERRDPPNGADMSTLRMPQPAQWLLSSESPSLPSSPARQIINESRRLSVAPQAIENRRRPLLPHRHPSGGRSTPDLRGSGPPMQLSLGQQYWLRRERCNQFRNDSVHLDQRIRIKFAPPTPGARKIQDYFASLEHAAEAENKERLRRGFSVQAPNGNSADPTLDPAQASYRLSRHQEIAEYTWLSAQLESRMRQRFESPEPLQQTRDRVEQAASVRHAAELERRLSIQFGDIDLPTENSSRSRRLSGTSSLPSRSISRRGLRPDAQPFSPQPRLNGLRTRSESPTPSERLGRTPAPVIVDGRTPEQRWRDPLPDTNKFYPAVQGNPAGPYSLGTYSPNPGEGEAGPSTYSRRESRNESVPASFLIGSPEEASEQDEDEALEIAQPSPGNKGKSPLRRTPSPPKHGEASQCAKAKSKSPSTSPPKLPHPFQPLDRQLPGSIQPRRNGAGPARLVNPVAAWLPGKSNPMHPDTPPRPTALRERRLDEHCRLLDHGLSEGEGSERVIASSSSEGEEIRMRTEREEEGFDADDEDDGEDLGLEKLFDL